MLTGIKIGVAGAGVFGSYHAAKYANRDGAELAGIFDIDLARADALAGKYRVEPFSDYRKFLDSIDAVIVAAPASTHFQLAEAALKAGKHVFVEKPLALSIDAADVLIELAEQRNLILQVGHQERYVCEAVGLLAREVTPLRVECIRRVPFSGRCGDVSAVFDLMVHDLDIVRQLARADAVNINAEGEDDDVSAELFLENGTLAVLNAGRRAKTSERKITVIYEDGVIEFDFIRRELTNSTPAKLLDIFNTEDSPLAMRDPLAYGAELFVKAIRNNETPVISGRAARTAVAWASEIERAANIQTDSVVKRLRA